MSSKVLLKRNFLEKLSCIEFGENFSFKKSTGELFQKTEDGWNRLSLVFLWESELNGWMINTSVGIRINSVEDTFHLASEFEVKYQKWTSTIGCFLEDYIKEYYNFRIALYSEQQIQEAVTKFSEHHFPLAKDYLSKNYGVKTIDALLNENPSQETIHCNEIFRGCKGLITAKLVNRSDIQILRAIYRHNYELFSDGFYLPMFNRIETILFPALAQDTVIKT